MTGLGTPNTGTILPSVLAIVNPKKLLTYESHVVTILQLFINGRLF